MLQGEWPKISPVPKTHLIQMLNRCEKDLCKDLGLWMHCKFKKLIELVNDPWTLPSLKRILHREPSPATPEESKFKSESFPDPKSKLGLVIPKVEKTLF